jgi:hypothetical protein
MVESKPGKHKHDKRYYNAFVVALCFSFCHSFFPSQTAAVLADESNLTKFDASEFSSTSFNDVDIAKQNYRDISVARGAHPKAKNFFVKTNLISHEEEQRKTVGERSVFENATESAPIHELAGDWVPDRIDLTSNGGFGIEPFNGSPVPYDLNGHVDAERGKP